MIRLASDEDFNNLILRGLRRRLTNVDVVRVQDAGLSAMTDETVLEWAAIENRVLLTHDARTMLAHVYARLSAGMTHAGNLRDPSMGGDRSGRGRLGSDHDLHRSV